MPTTTRADRIGKHQTLYNKNRKRILMMYDTCYLCGQIVDKSLKAGDPMAPEVDHIIPVSQLAENDPRLSSIDNLCLTHAICNRRKGGKAKNGVDTEIKKPNQQLTWSIDWTEYRT